jgi:hypothetical protein
MDGVVAPFDHEFKNGETPPDGATDIDPLLSAKQVTGTMVLIALI